MGFARLAEDMIRKVRGKGEKDSLGAMDKIVASTVGGALATWNQPIEVVRVEMQSMAKGAAADANRPAKLTIMNTLKYIYSQNGIKGLYRGVTPRIGLGVWQTICMVSFADYVKAWYAFRRLLDLKDGANAFYAGSPQNRGAYLPANYVHRVFSRYIPPMDGKLFSRRCCLTLRMQNERDLGIRTIETGTILR